MYQKKKTQYFGNSAAFVQLEEQAIDGQLSYDEYPPEEYRYFSKLSRLGYLNRHSGWSKEICEAKQEEYRKEYREACKLRDERLDHARQLQARLIRSQELDRRLHTATHRRDALDIALELLEILLEEPGLARNIYENLKNEYN